jgi:hypothetical protein
MSEYSDKSQTLWSGPSQQESHEASVPERRMAQRFPFTAAAEVIDLRSKTRLIGRSSDLGLGGCYIDTFTPFAVGDTVQIRLERNRRELEATGIVAYALVSMGMGILFTDIKPEYKDVLKTWIAELSGEKAAIPEAGSPSPDQNMLATVASNRQALNELINLMVRKKFIGEDEGARLLRLMFG